MDFEQQPAASKPETENKQLGRRICAWCDKDRGPAECGDTHGICEECVLKVKTGEFKAPKQTFNFEILARAFAQEKAEIISSDRPLQEKLELLLNGGLFDYFINSQIKVTIDKNSSAEDLTAALKKLQEKFGLA